MPNEGIAFRPGGMHLDMFRQLRDHKRWTNEETFKYCVEQGSLAVLGRRSPAADMVPVKVAGARKATRG